MIWRCADRILDLTRCGEVMGIVNVTPDSFSDGGDFATHEMALEHARSMIAEGAAFIDVGGESTRPGAKEVSEEEEKRRVLPVIEGLVMDFPSAIISVDTCKPGVAREAIRAGAKVINDVRGFRDAAMIEAAADASAGLVVMHMRGTPRTMQESPVYADLCGEITEFFRERFDALTSAGVDPERVVFDPGIGFGKTVEHNLSILHDLPRYTIADRPILLGVSRKSFLRHYAQGVTAKDRDWATVAVTAWATEKGVKLHRVHDVKRNLQALRMMEAILG